MMSHFSGRPDFILRKTGTDQGDFPSEISHQIPCVKSRDSRMIFSANHKSDVFKEGLPGDSVDQWNMTIY